MRTRDSSATVFDQRVARLRALALCLADSEIDPVVAGDKLHYQAAYGHRDPLVWLVAVRWSLIGTIEGRPGDSLVELVALGVVALAEAHLGPEAADDAAALGHRVNGNGQHDPLEDDTAPPEREYRTRVRAADATSDESLSFFDGSVGFGRPAAAR
jgi:hypothetical protein